jgi:hypothetical protein
MSCVLLHERHIRHLPSAIHIRPLSVCLTFISWRSGLMGFSLMESSCLEGGVFDPSILKTERPHRHLRSINMVSTQRHTTNGPATSPAVAGSFPGPSATSQASPPGASAIGGQPAVSAFVAKREEEV